jgi:heat shock protein HslJ/uncharacterized membrane protein/membrane-bound inhibitor of C-type lysozyme
MATFPKLTARVGAALLALLAAACAGRPAGEATPLVTPGTYVFTCPDGMRFAAAFRDDSVTLDLGVRSVALPRVVSASGTRYESDNVLFHARGGEALLRIAQQEHRECGGARIDDPWERARALGVQFRAVGQEPGWVLEIAPDRGIRFIGDYGRTRIAAPVPEPRTRADGTLVYDARSEAHHLVAEIREAACRDAMSGEPFSHTVTVRFDGNSLRGCGRDVTAPSIVGPRWSLVEMDGAAVPADAGIELRFDAEGRVSGSTGCNNLGGPVEVQDRRLRFGDLATTRRACLDPARSAREQAFVSRLATVDGYTVGAGTLELHTGGRPILHFSSRPD